MSDLLVKLYSVEDCPELIGSLEDEGIHIMRVLSPDKYKVIQFIRENFTEGWCSETEAGFTNTPISVFVASKDKKVIGFAAYDATARGYFGPVGVSPDFRKKGICQALTVKCMLDMKNVGYGYAIIGWTGGYAKHLYERYVGAVEIPDSHPGVYSRYINVACDDENKPQNI